MEGAMLLQKSAIPASTMLLDNCTHAIEQGNYEEALNICIQFLENYPVDNSNRDKNSIVFCLRDIVNKRSLTLNS